MPLTVALDATPLQLAHGGLKRYTIELHRALEREFPEDRYLLTPPQPGRWWLSGLPRELRRLGVDVFHGTNFEVPLSLARPSVVTIHDLSPWRGFPASSRVRLRTPLLLGLGLANFVVTPSEAIRREVIAEFGVAPSRVATTPLASSDAFFPSPGPGVCHLLYAGDNGPRKNLETIRQAARELGLALEETAATQPDDAKLRQLYSSCSVFLYPSLYEGFGLPVLEAMRCGAPVIISDDPALLETAGDAAITCPARDVRAWKEAIQAALANRLHWREKSLRRAALFSWSRTARLTREIYLAASSRHFA